MADKRAAAAVSARNDEPAPAADPVAEARRAELERQEAVRQAVWDRNHNPDGTPKPVVP
jgi:hypothetical protein